ncbi:MAG: CBS domain-containing protein [Chitinophagaceae bacterium]|nr:MAG: CBS domain-containing protein [Chitinophagaceae bacterium]
MSKGITSQNEDYSQWYNDIVIKADLAEHSAVRGCMVIKPYGYSIWERMQAVLDQKFKDTGHSNAYFPLFVPKSLFEKEEENAEGFAKFHPGGALGKKLYLRVSDLYVDNEKPQVATNANIKEVIVEMTKKRLGVTAVTDAEGRLAGIITDGDLRRMLEKTDNIQTIAARDIMTQKPKTILPAEMAVNALDIMRSNSITTLAVVENGIYLGILHLHDLVKEGLL